MATGWLKSVNALLENLDDTVGDAVEQAEERLEDRLDDAGAIAGAAAEEDDGTGMAIAGVGGKQGVVGGSGAAAAATAAVSTLVESVASPAVGRVGRLASKTSVDDILARRGLLDDDDEEDEDEAADAEVSVEEEEEITMIETGSATTDGAAGGGGPAGTRPPLFQDDDDDGDGVVADLASVPADTASVSGQLSVTAPSFAPVAEAGGSGGGNDNAVLPTASLPSETPATGLEPPSSAGAEAFSNPPADGRNAGDGDGDGNVEDDDDAAAAAAAAAGGGDAKERSASEGSSSSASVVIVAAEDAAPQLPPSAPSTTSSSALLPPDSSSSAPSSSQHTPATAPPSIDLAAAAVSKAVESAEARSRIDELQTALSRQTALTRKAGQEARDAEKELRKLRRHVVKLNSELEAAEGEVDAQRTELERAAERMERDRTRHKEEREREKREYEAGRRAAEAEHRAALDAMSAKHAERVADMETQLRRANEAREKEGGDWNKELEDALRREREVVKKMMGLEDEKQTLTNQVTTLQGQMAAMQSRLDSVSETADTAAEREREADDRLDAALSLHARQISQRQAREAELERTVAELGAALAVARQREQARSGSSARSVGAAATGVDGMAAGGGEDQSSSLRARLETAEEELETARTQLMLEQQRCETLQRELQEITQERTEEASAVQARQKQYDRQVSDMSTTISRLQTSLRDLKKAESAGGIDGNGDEVASPAEFAELKKRVSTLSQLVVQQQSKIDDGKVEISTLRSRLRAATSRAEAAEKAMTMSGNDTGTDLSDMEMGGARYAGNKMRRRGMRGGGRSSKTKAKSLRSAMKLDPGRGGSDAHEQIGSAIDALDRWSVETGSYLRADPLARGVFLLYLLVLHLWAFCLLFFHAHNDLDASGVGVGHGPQAYVQQSYQNIGERLHSQP